MATIDQVYEIVQDVQEKVSELVIWKAQHVEHHKIVSRDIKEVREDLYEGNPGIIQEVRRLSNNKKAASRVASSWKGLGFYILERILVFGIIGIIVWFLFLYREIDNKNIEEKSNKEIKDVRVR